jgi:plastocyanin
MLSPGGPPVFARLSGIGAKFVLAWLAGVIGASAAIAAGKTYVVHMLDSAPFFSEPELSIAVGDTVEWINDGPEKKHIVSDNKCRYFREVSKSTRRGNILSTTPAFLRSFAVSTFTCVRRSLFVILTARPSAVLSLRIRRHLRYF